MLALIALFGPNRGIRIPLGGELTIGRSPTANLQWVDAKVSREHCRLGTTDGNAWIEDLGSQNGTYVNGEAISTRITLHESDEIAIGDTLLVVAGSSIDVENARYGEGALLLADETQALGGSNVIQSDSPETAGPILTTLIRKLATAQDESAVAHAILDTIASELKPSCAVLLVHLAGAREPESKERLVPLAIRGAKDLPSISRTLLRFARNKGRGILIGDVQSYRELQGAKSLHRQAARTIMVVPFGFADSNRGGYIHVDRAAEQPFTSSQLSWLETLAHLASLRLTTHVQTTVAPAEEIVGEEPSYLEAMRMADAVARADSTVMIQGETGTGKEAVAHRIHERSRRHEGPFITINCGAISETLAESELFGHEKGAFTGATVSRLGAFENADGGTIFLDEIGELPLSQQVKLLRVLQDRMVVRVGSMLPRRVDVRVVTATHRDLEADVKSGRFREDLLFRLNVVQILVPPLRQRKRDIPLLTRTLLTRAANRLGVRVPELSNSAFEALATWDFPGNIRELGNVLERILVLRDPVDPSTIDANDVRAALGRDPSPMTDPPEGSGDETLAESVARLERRRIEAALRKARGVKLQAAKLLGISRPTLDKKISDLQIDIWT